MSNSNYNLTLKCKATYKGQDIEFTFDPYNDCTDIDGLKELAISEFDADEVNDGEEITTDDIVVVITDYDDVPADYANETSVWEFAEAFAECDQDIDVVEAALYCGVSARNIDEAYSGSFKDDEEFAEDFAEQVGAIDRDTKWPMNCIDWEQAAKELMYDYSEHNGYYFRSL